MKNKNIIRLAIATACILMIPLVAMQFTSEVNWILSDFVFAGALIFGTGLAYLLISKKGPTIQYRAAVGMALATAFLLVWINGAVGIIGNEENPANLMYVGVLAVGLIGTCIARFQPHDMAWVLFAMALTQLLVPVIALIIWPPQDTSWGAAGVFGVLVLNSIFALLFAGSSLLFRSAIPRARNQTI